jgi:hypothetical protein
MGAMGSLPVLKTTAGEGVKREGDARWSLAQLPVPNSISANLGSGESEEMKNHGPAAMASSELACYAEQYPYLLRLERILYIMD